MEERGRRVEKTWEDEPVEEVEEVGWFVMRPVWIDTQLVRCTAAHSPASTLSSGRAADFSSSPRCQASRMTLVKWSNQAGRGRGRVS